MEEFDWFGAIVSSIGTMIAGLLVAFINRYGFRFWRNWRTLRVSGNLKFIGKMSPHGVEVVETTIEQQLFTNGFLKLKGKRAVLTGNYYLKLTTGKDFSGHMKCFGTSDGRNIHLIYNIFLDTDKHRNWNGIMIFTLPEWEEISGFYMSKSQRGSYNHGIGHVKLKVL